MQENPKTYININQKDSFRKGKIGSVGNSIRTILSKYTKSDGFYYATVTNRWEQIVGVQLAEKTVPISFLKRGHEKVLVIRAQNISPTELMYQNQMIIQAVNNYFGIKWVHRLILKH